MQVRASGQEHTGTHRVATDSKKTETDQSAFEAQGPLPPSHHQMFVCGHLPGIRDNTPFYPGSC